MVSRDAACDIIDRDPHLARGIDSRQFGPQWGRAHVVEVKGLEPSAYGLQSRRSSS
jgi:hypothetical protein